MAVPPADPSDPAGPSGDSERTGSDASGGERSDAGRSGAGRSRRSRRSDAGRPASQRDERDDAGHPAMPPESLRGRVLVASRQLRDPNFFRTLVLLVDHGDDGAFGLIVNRPTDTSVRRALAGHVEVESGSERVFEGGPVEPAALFVLHNSVEFADGELPICSGLFVGSSREAFEGLIDAVDAGDERTRYRVFTGCAGWGPGQLEQELARADWRVTDAEALLDGPADPIFGPDPYSAWEAADRLVVPPPLDGLDGGDFRMN